MVECIERFQTELEGRAFMDRPQRKALEDTERRIRRAGSGQGDGPSRVSERVIVWFPDIFGVSKITATCSWTTWVQRLPGALGSALQSGGLERTVAEGG